MISIWVAFIVITIQQISSTPMFADKIVGAFDDVKDLVNMNQMMIIDKIAVKMDKTQPFKGTNFSAKFKNDMYAMADLPMTLLTNFVESIANVESILDKFKHDITEADSDDTTDGAKSDDTGAETEAKGDDTGDHTEAKEDDTSANTETKSD